MATNNKPTHTLRCDNIKATIWENVSERGSFFATTFSRPFKDQSGAWRTGTSFGLNDLSAFFFKWLIPSCHSKLTQQFINDTYLPRCIIVLVEGNESIIVAMDV